MWISKLSHYLDLAYASKEARIVSRQQSLRVYITENFPPSTQSAMVHLPIHLLSFGPLYDLMEGFITDIDFHAEKLPSELRFFPIQTEHDLKLYSARVAGTVAELCLELVFHHSHSNTKDKLREHLMRSGGRMGIALQYVNISRDITTDANIGRVYLPTTWIREENLTPLDVLENPEGLVIERLRQRLLAEAFKTYREARSALEQLPLDCRASLRVAVESYMEIGRVLSEKGCVVKEGKASVPKLRRLRVAWKAISEG
jgi:15-cis-phytoene synthase/lycopene beta-cyclase